MSNGVRLRLLGIVVLAVIAVGAIYLLSRSDEPWPIQGVVHATELRVAPEVGGHLAAVRVRKGDRVKRGDVVAVLSAAELSASVEQAHAAYKNALAERDNVFAGVRKEQIATSAAEVEKARSRQTYAEQQLSRFTRLVEANFSPRQALDQATKEGARAGADVAEATATSAAARVGPTAQERAIAEASVRAAVAQVAVLETRLRKT